MRRLDETLSDLVESRRAKGPDALIDALRRRLEADGDAVAMPWAIGADSTRTWNRWRGPLITAGALAAAVLLVAAPILWLGGGDGTTSADGAPAPTAVLSSHLEPAPLQLGDTIGFSQSGDTLWAWDGEGGVAGYRDGVWQALPPLPGPVWDVAGTKDVSVWALADSNLWHLEDGDWRTLPAEVALHSELETDSAKVEVDSATGIVWVLSGADLYRWDGVEMSQAASSPEGMILDDFVVAGDGTIWGARDNFYFPWMDRLARFDEDSSGWVSVRPLGGSGDLPSAVAVTPGGNLWVGLQERDALRYEPTGFALAHRDTTTGEWARYRLPSGSTRDLVADDDLVWFHGEGLSDLIRFDGETAATFSLEAWVDNLGLGNDGTLWITIRDERNGVYRLVIDEESTG